MVFADSVNLARRLSSKNENDLVQESILGKGSNHSKDQCMALSRKLSDYAELPMECRGFKDVVSNLNAKTDSSAIAFQGMGNSAAAAASARQKGQQNYAQIQRRFTNTRRFTKERS